jgi:hypothetical protein
MKQAKKRSGSAEAAEQPKKKKTGEKKSQKKGATPPQAALKPPEKAPPATAAKPGLPSLPPKPPSNAAVPPGRPTLPGSGTPSPSSSPFQPPRPPSGLFGAARPNARVTWEIIPTHDLAVRIDVSSLHLELYKLIGIQPPPAEELLPGHPKAAFWGEATLGVPKAVAQVISDYLDEYPDAESLLKQKLDEAWEKLHFIGAAFVYNWRNEARVALATRIQAIQHNPIILRPTDPLLTLNLLTRARSGTLIGNMPAAVERAFLEKHLFTDDPRIVAMVKASGFSEELLIDPPVDDETTEELS